MDAEERKERVFFVFSFLFERRHFIIMFVFLCVDVRVGEEVLY